MVKKQNDNQISTYINSLENKVLTKEEEIELFIKMKNGDKKAKVDLIKYNLRLVIGFFKSKLISLDMDLIQEGNLVLIELLDKFELSNNTKFSTLYYKAMNNRLIDILNERNNQGIYVPVNIMRASNKHYETLLTLSDEKLEEYLKKHKITKTKYNDIMTYNLKKFSLDKKDDENKEFELETKDQTNDIIDELFYSRIKKLIYISNLSPEQIEVLLYRYGFKQEKQLNYKEIAEEIGVSRESIRNYEKAALNKIRTQNYSELYAYNTNISKIAQKTFTHKSSNAIIQ